MDNPYFLTILSRVLTKVNLKMLFSSQDKMSCWDILLVLLIILLAGLLFFLRGFQDNRILPMLSESSLDPLPTQHKAQVRIILPTGGSGLIQDAKIYQALIPNSYIIQVDRGSPETHPEAKKEVDVNLYLETPLAAHTCFPAKKKWLMANQEFFYPRYLNDVDVIMTKSRYAEKLLTDYVKKVASPSQVVYTGFTSFPYVINHNKDWHLMVHFAGNSRYKGTKSLLRLWQKNKGFRHLVPDSRLIVTCRNYCLTKITEEVEGLPFKEDHWEDPETGLFVYIHLSDEKLAEIRRRAGVFLCPSIVEGYGHYINEGAANASVVMTTDFPPMNELVPRTPFLIPPAGTLGSWNVFEPFGFVEPYFIDKHLPESKACWPDMQQLEKIITNYFQLSTSEKEHLGQLNYDHYQQRQEEFRHLLTSFLDRQF